MAQCVAPAHSHEYERRLARRLRRRGSSQPVRTPVSVGALAAGVAAVDARPAWPVDAVRGAVANGAPPFLDHGARPSEVEGSLVLGFRSPAESLTRGCDIEPAAQLC